MFLSHPFWENLHCDISVRFHIDGPVSLDRLPKVFVFQSLKGACLGFALDISFSSTCKTDRSRQGFSDHPDFFIKAEHDEPDSLRQDCQFANILLLCYFIRGDIKWQTKSVFNATQ